MKPSSPTAVLKLKTLSLDPIRPSDIPPDEAFIEAGESILKSSASWKQGKTFHDVKTFRGPRVKPGEPASWHCRVSEHRKEDVSFEKMWEKLGQNKAMNEKEFVPEVQKATLVKYISDTQSIWSMYYTLPSPLSPRVYTVLQVTRLTEWPSRERTGVIISVPVDLSSPSDKGLAELEEPGVKGRYICVEQIKELDDGKVIEWRMATCGESGGFIPQFIVERSMPKKISEDVPHFMTWLRSFEV